MELQPILDNDAADFAELSYSIGMSPTADVSAAQAFIKFLNSPKAIGRKLVVNGSFVGGGQLTIQKYPHIVEAGFWVKSDYQGRGYGSAIARLLTELALGPLGFHRVFAKTFSNNIKSQRCLERCGMLREGVLRDAGLKDGIYYDEIYYARLSASSPSA